MKKTRLASRGKARWGTYYHGNRMTNCGIRKVGKKLEAKEQEKGHE
ncbi:MAG: hypothetical protein NC131_10780 [Roseburia sp.]|nr:hypothetical protein [Roseburia sp.]